MTRAEILDAVKRLFIADGTEKELDDLCNTLDEAVPNGNIIDLIFHPDQERTPEEVVEEALRREREHKSILLPLPNRD